jgi:hypothetical protein
VTATSANIALIEAAVLETNIAEEGAFATFVVKGKEDLFVQYIVDGINARYPFSADPRQMLRTFPIFSVEEWVANEYLWVGITLSANDTATWIDRYFREILGCDPGYELVRKSE